MSDMDGYTKGAFGHINKRWGVFINFALVAVYHEKADAEKHEQDTLKANATPTDSGYMPGTFEPFTSVRPVLTATIDGDEFLLPDHKHVSVNRNGALDQ